MNERGHTITKEIFDEIVAPLGDEMIVQRAGLIHGSLLFFKMGKDLQNINIQRLHLTIEALAWTLCVRGSEVINSTSITREFAETTVQSVVKGSHFTDFTVIPEGQMVIMAFENDIEIRLLFNNPWGQYNRLFSLYLPNRQSIILRQSPLPELYMEIGGQGQVN